MITVHPVVSLLIDTVKYLVATAFVIIIIIKLDKALRGAKDFFRGAEEVIQGPQPCRSYNPEEDYDPEPIPLSPEEEAAFEELSWRAHA